MSDRSHARLLLAALATGACTWSAGPVRLEIQGVAPAEVPDHVQSLLRIDALGLDGEIVVDFDAGTVSTGSGPFQATLVQGALRIPLADVRRISSTALEATLPPGAPRGPADLELRDGAGRVALRPGALTIFAAECLDEGAPCDLDPCTLGGTCVAWRCLDAKPVVCAASDACHLPGTCDPASGLCSDPEAPDGTPCQVTCASGDTCRSGVCTPAPAGCDDTPPLARLTVTPGGGTAGLTEFTLDASGSVDAEDPVSSLRYRFDGDGDGEWTTFSDSPTLTRRFDAPGVHTAAVEVRDSGGLSGFASVLVVVAPPGDEVRVTTALDERDAGATSAAPGGTGLSLREAVAWVNALAEPRVITLDAPMSLLMTGAQRGLSLTAPGAAVVATRGVSIDFDRFNQACIRLDGPGQRLVGATITGCTSVFVQLTGRSAGSQVAHVTVAETARTAVGLQGLATSLPASLLGPGNDLSGLATAVDAQGTGYEIFESRLHGNAVGVELYGNPARLARNVVWGQVGTAPQGGFGVRAYTGAGPIELFHNVFAANGDAGVRADAIGAFTVRNNLFFGNGAVGLAAQAAGLLHDHDGFFGNAGGAVSSGLSTGPTDLLSDPRFVDAAGGDFRLLPASPAADAGIDTGVDANGPAPGLYTGAAPDLGAAEVR